MDVVHKQRSHPLFYRLNAKSRACRSAFLNLMADRGELPFYESLDISYTLDKFCVYCSVRRLQDTF